MQIVKYSTESEAQSIIEQKKTEGLILIEVANITEGNFLGFSEAASLEPSALEQRLDDMQTSIDLLLLKQEGIL